MIPVLVTGAVVLAVILLAIPAHRSDRRARRNRQKQERGGTNDRDRRRARTGAAIAQLTAPDLNRVLEGICRASAAEHHTTKG